jgi:hypothetical protein
MARRKKHRVGSHRRRHRVSGIKDTAMKAATVVLGAVGGAFIKQALTTAVPSLSASAPWAPGAILIAGGIFLPKIVKGPMGAGLADGLIAFGGLSAINESFISIPGVSGLGALPRRVPARVIGAGARPFLSKMVGATPRPYTRTTVGQMSGMGSAYAEMEAVNRAAMGGAMGSLMMED